MELLKKETIEIALSTWEGLIRKSERLEMVREYVESSGYCNKDDLKVILGIKRD